MSDLALDLGCGTNKRPEAIGLDMNPGLEGIVDVIHEVRERIFLPFRDNSFAKIYMIDFIEHILSVPWLLSEVHRVAVNGAIVEIRFPHYSSPNAHSDVTHVHHELGLHSLDHFDPSTLFGKKYQYYTLYGRYFPFKIEEIQPEFEKSKSGNCSRVLYLAKGMDFYEKYVCKVIPLDNIQAILRVNK